MTAYLLVALQMAFMGALCLPVADVHGLRVPAVLLAAAGLGWLAWALAVNPPPNIHIRPVLKPGSRLVVAGPYRLVRHPMYFGVLVCGAAPVCLWPAAWKAVVWLLLAVVLTLKARREEAALARHHPDYESYRRGRRFLVPGLW